MHVKPICASLPAVELTETAQDAILANHDVRSSVLHPICEDDIAFPLGLKRTGARSELSWRGAAFNGTGISENAEHQELTAHQAGESQVLLAHAQAAHYGAGVLISNSKDGSWHKVSAPWFVYVNNGSSQSALWADAKRRAAQEVAAWPYPWLDAKQFELNRGRVSGRLSFGRNQPAAGARVILAEHEANPSTLLWQQQWRGYRFRGWADADGRLDVGKVRPGNYDLCAWQPGSFGCFRWNNVAVAPGEQVTSVS